MCDITLYFQYFLHMLVSQVYYTVLLSDVQSGE